MPPRCMIAYSRESLGFSASCCRPPGRQPALRSASEVSHQIGPTLAPLASASSGIDAPVEGHEIPGSTHPHGLLGHRIVAHAEQRLRALLLRGAVVVEAHEQQRAVAAHREERARPGGVLERASRGFDFAHELASPGVDDRDALCRIEVVDQQESVIVRQHGVAHHRHAGRRAWAVWQFRRRRRAWPYRTA